MAATRPLVGGHASHGRGLRSRIDVPEREAAQVTEWLQGMARLVEPEPAG